MKNYDMYYDKFFRPMMDSIEKDNSGVLDDEPTDWEALDGPSPFGEKP